MADPVASPVPPPFAKIMINAGVIHIEYEGPPEYLKELPALIEELEKAVRGTATSAPSPSPAAAP